MFKKPKDGTGIREALTLVLGAASLAIAVDANERLLRFPTGVRTHRRRRRRFMGSSSNLSYPSADSYYIAIDESYAYYGTGNGFARMLKNNTGTMATLYQSFVPEGPLATDDTYLYYADHNGTSGIYKIPKTGGSPVQVSTDPHINALFVSGKALYWITAGTGNSDDFGESSRCSRATLAASGERSPGTFAHRATTSTEGAAPAGSPSRRGAG